MRTVVMALLVHLFPHHDTIAQDSTASDVPVRRKVKQGIWYTPSKANVINGFAVGIATNAEGMRVGGLSINGVNLEANPLSLFAIPYVLAGALSSPFTIKDTLIDQWAVMESGYAGPEGNADTQVNGVSISTAYWGDVHGVNLSAVLTSGSEGDGISVCGGTNSFNRFHGIMVAGLHNRLSRSHAILQVGLLNYCLDCKGVQIGLINRMGRRTLPFVNIRL